MEPDACFISPEEEPADGAGDEPIDILAQLERRMAAFQFRGASAGRFLRTCGVPFKPDADRRQRSHVAEVDGNEIIGHGVQGRG